MSPNTSYDRTERGITVAGYEYEIDIFDEYFENGVPPHARDYLWDSMDLSDIARGFDAGDEYGSSVLREQTEYAAESYHELTAQEKQKLHDHMVKELKTKKTESDETVRVYRGIVPRLLQALVDTPEPHKTKVEETIKKMLDDAEKINVELADDLDLEEEWTQ